jgi:hypothetical protein
MLALAQHDPCRTRPVTSNSPATNSTCAAAVGPLLHAWSGHLGAVAPVSIERQRRARRVRRS